MSQRHLSVHPHSEKMPLLIGFSSSFLNLKGPVIPPLDMVGFQFVDVDYNRVQVKFVNCNQEYSIIG